jgi:SAM-dependent methyltransferase
MEKKKTGRSIKEKRARMPDIREPKWDQIVPAYLESVKSLSSEPAKSQPFLVVLNDLFGLQPGFIEDYVSGIEKYIKVKQKDRILKGKVDDLFGNLVIEFERDLDKKEIEAEEQLRKYVACLWSQETPRQRIPYLCVASDGKVFTVYSPTIEDLAKTDIKPEEVRLELNQHVDLSTLKPQEIYFWLDRYFLRKEILSPKTESIVKDFGIKSHAFRIGGQNLLSLWQNLKARPEFAVIYEGWEKYLRIVYGTSIAEEELFIRHTYLATLAKLMAWSRLTEERGSLDTAEIASVLEGHFFKDRGIENFLEEDFFSWLARKDAKDDGMEIARKLLSLLQNYNLREISEDVLKGLYQELVDPKARHDLGEYYTPDWLAHRMIQNLLKPKPDSSILDPACGSGTFLYLAIREKRDYLGKSTRTLKHVLSSVAGADIHPLAVIVAKTNYILALGDLLKKRKGKISIPIYLSDTVRLPEREVQPTLWMQVPSYRVNLAGEPIYLPEELISEPSLYDEAIDAAEGYAVQNMGKEITKTQFLNFLRARHSTLAENDALAKALFRISEILKTFIDSNRDTIWAFVLKNIYKPLFLKGKFDIVLGNPPWLSYRYVEQLDYQKFLKEQITQIYGLLSGKGELITHLELGTLFFVRTAHLYLKEPGTIAFVLPRSIFNADQHDTFRKGIFKQVGLSFKESRDLEEVKPLFNVPSRVLFAQKVSGTKASYPIAGQRFSGELQRKNASLCEAQQKLTFEDVWFSLHRKGKRSFWSTQKSAAEEKESHYKRHFHQEGTIFPRASWFVEIKISPLGFDPSLPPLETSVRAKKEAKEAYKGLIMKGNVEDRFIYATLLSTDLLPFGHLDYRLVVLPIEPFGSGYKLIRSDEARKRGFLNFAKWLEKAQDEWEKRRGGKAKQMNIYERLDRSRLSCSVSQVSYLSLCLCS